MSHKDIIKQKAIALQNLNSTAQARITDSILFNAAKEIKERVSETNYSKYVGLFSEEPVTEELHECTDDEAFLVKLGLAEAYFCLYFLAVAVKQIQDSNFGLVRASGGSGGVGFESFKSIIDSMGIFKAEAENLLTPYLGGTGRSNWIAI